MPVSKIYILGAGCSKHCGYPLGPEMRECLERFRESLDPITSPRLRTTIADTVALMHGSVDTIDTLVQKLYDRHLDSEIGLENADVRTKAIVRHRRAQAASLAISAAFLAKEKSVRDLGFARYRDFLYQLFPGAASNWFDIDRSACAHVLTFNYDQVFEIAFLDRFKINSYSLYGQSVLNSGLNLNGIGFEPDAFSFLKLHGSVGIWIGDFPGDPMYFQDEPDNKDPGAIKDSLFFVDRPNNQDTSELKRDPLLFFPSQRQHILSQETGFLFHGFARAVWNRATELISNATEIHTIGYSFSGIDRGPMLNLLGQARNCQRLVIQSPDSDQICNRLKLERPHLRELIESVPIAF